MFRFLLKIRRWIKATLKVQSESRQVEKRSIRSRTNKFLILVGAAVVIGGLYPAHSLYDPLDMPQKGETSHEDIIAPSQIVVKKTARELREEKDLIRGSMPLIIDADTIIPINARDNLRKYLFFIDSLKKQLPPDDELTREKVVEKILERYPQSYNTNIKKLLGLADLRKVNDYLIDIYNNDLYRVGILPDGVDLPDIRNKSILVRFGEKENMFSRDNLLFRVSASMELLTALNRLYATDSIDVDLLYKVGNLFILPNLKLNEGEYESRIQEQIDAIKLVKEVVEPGDIIIRSGSRVTERQERVLAEMAQLMREKAAESSWFEALLPLMARILLVLVAFSTLYLFLFHFRKEIYNSNPKLLALILVFFFQMFLIYLASEQFEFSMYFYPIAMLPIIVTILFDTEVGILSTMILALLLGIMHRFNFSIVLMTMAIGTVGCMASREVRRRTDFFKIMLFISLAYIIFIPVVEKVKLTPIEDLLPEMGYGILSGIFCAFITIGVLPFLESIFGITTDIRLLELSDMNHPILKRLALEAPGTYHHSIIVGNLTESASKAVGGNPLLARVGAYYHDIGKIAIPEYFVENQLSIKSKHEELTPSMSALILAAHVKKGRQLGEASDIPDDVLNFIEEHHGTMVMTYFYNKALEEEGDEVSIDKFRYPGPKPQTRETGIAMLADAVEAASRTLEDPKPARIHNLIKRIIEDRMKSGELDECPLTLRDLAAIREAFAQILIGAFHHRVVYPTRKEDDKKDK